MNKIRYRVWDGKKMWYPPKKEDWTWRLARTGQVWRCTLPPPYYEPVEEKPRKSIAMLSIGIQDRNGKEIYEGDILEFQARKWGDSVSNKWAVTWNTKEGCWDTGGGTYGECAVWKTVIGNIYENPDLLK